MTDQDTPITVSEAAIAMRVLQRFLSQLATTAVDHAECPSIVSAGHFTLDIAGKQGDGKSYGGHDFQIWIHMEKWAEHVMHADPEKVAAKAVAMAHMVESLRNLRDRAEVA